MSIQNGEEKKGVTDKNQPPKDSTNLLPMIDLEECIKLVSDIHEQGLETALMPAVAKAIGYKNATSTPFYRRQVAARLFGLLHTGAELTTRAMDYLKPHDEGAAQMALNVAIMGIPIYADLLTKHEGKKINIALLANSLERDLRLTPGCASTCAKVFFASIKFAGMVRGDGTVGVTSITVEEKNAVPPVSIPSAEPTVEAEDVQQHTLFLDKNKTRKFTFTGPIAVSRSEYDRICKWLEMAMIVAAKDEVVT